MGNTNSMISVMFEEIKSLLTSIDKTLNEKEKVKESLSASEAAIEQKSDAKTNTPKPEQLLRLIAAHLQETERKIGQLSDTIKESEKHVFYQIEELKQITSSQKTDSKVHHFHVVEWKSSKVVIAIVSLSILFLGSLIGNMNQLEVNSRMTDNDLKYQYIKSTNGINHDHLKKLEDIFHYHRDKKVISEIREKVYNYEYKINEAAEKLVPSRMNESDTQK